MDTTQAARLMDQATIRKLRASNEYDLMAARLLDCAAVHVEKGWTQNTSTRDEHGVETDDRGPDAVCWCAQGAMHAASQRIGLTVVDEFGCATYANPDLASHVEPRARFALQMGIKGGEIIGGPWIDPAHVRAVSITSWNDKHGQTQQAVVEAFQTGAAHIRTRLEVVQDGIRRAEDG